MRRLIRLPNSLSVALLSITVAAMSSAQPVESIALGSDMVGGTVTVTFPTGAEAGTILAGPGNSAFASSMPVGKWLFEVGLDGNQTALTDWKLTNCPAAVGCVGDIIKVAIDLSTSASLFDKSTLTDLSTLGSGLGSPVSRVSGPAEAGFGYVASSEWLFGADLELNLNAGDMFMEEFILWNVTDFPTGSVYVWRDDTDKTPDNQLRQAHPIPLGVSGIHRTDCTAFFTGTLGSLVRDLPPIPAVPSWAVTALAAVLMILGLLAIRYQRSSGARAAFLLLVVVSAVVAARNTTAATQALGILSNNHVLARENAAVLGDDAVQPGCERIECGCAVADTVADLARFQVLVPDVSPNPGQVDAAVATIRTGDVDPTGTILGIGPPGTIPIRSNINLVGMPVKKSGRTTGVTHGEVKSVNSNIIVPYDPGDVTFNNQILIQDVPGGTPNIFSAGGDSGSLIVADTSSCPAPVGLLFAGNLDICNRNGQCTASLGTCTTHDDCTESITVANPILEVQQKMRVRIVGCEAGASAAAEGLRAAQDTRPEVSSDDYERALQAKESAEEALFAVPGVIGVGLTRSKSDPSQPVIIVFVESETDEIARRVPAQIDGFEVEVDVLGALRPF